MRSPAQCSAAKRLPKAPDPVLVGGSSDFRLPGAEAAMFFHHLKIGDIFWTEWPRNPGDLEALLRFCRDNRLKIIFREIRQRGSLEFRPEMAGLAALSRAERERILATAGACFGGRQAFGEAGGMTYWPKSYTLNRRAGQWAALPPVQTMEQAKQAFMDLLREYLAYERNTVARTTFTCIDSSLMLRYMLEAGVDLPILEMLPGDPHLLISALRGAARAYGKPWATHIAMQCYGGVTFDKLWLKRWRTSLDYSYMSGAQYLWSENGHISYQQRPGQKFSVRSREMKTVRRILRETWQFARTHTRPADGPRAGIAVVAGHLDGAPGMWNPFAWGQYHARKWREGPPERGWLLPDRFFRKESWALETVQGETDFSGNPPYGQYDVVPAEASLDALRRYRCLVFLGWNTMTPELYGKLKAYVRGGGHLVMWLAHLSTHTDRAKDLALFRKGDFRDLFGVRVIGKGRKDVLGAKCIQSSSLPNYRFPFWRAATDPRFIGRFTPARCRVTTAAVLSGWADYYYDSADDVRRRPLILENSCGRGKAFLVAAWEYPADDGMQKLAQEVLRTVQQGEQGEIRLLSSDRVRYAVYDAVAPGSPRPHQVVYLLNTDPDCGTLARLWVRGRTSQDILLRANTMRLVYRSGSLLFAPEDRRIDLASWRARNGMHCVEFFNVEPQNVEILNLATKAVGGAVNGRRFVCPPAGRLTVRLGRRVDPRRREYYAGDFLNEPSIPEKWVSIRG